MFGALFWIIFEFLSQRRVFFRRRTAGAGARNRTDGGNEAAVPLFLPHENFGRGPHHVEVPEVVVVHVRGRVQRSQSPVKRDRVFGKRPLNTLPNLHLHQVPGGNVVLGADHGL